MTYVITEPCIDLKDATCVDVCPVDCIHTTDDDKQFYIDPEICIDCEACVYVCPVDAIFYEEDVPEKWKKFTKINLDYFSAKTDE
ncbi:MAG: ferredoxin family protein, partial [Chloroflexi bacterium]|nr:ferredoxin family protein [Chloroflexota bacterium]MCI0856714.1 ferredoxin family protein [Chloroflexota bacterium]MCI0890819.1 ferredoxin family protein [Chloroflexota bacterium]